MTEREKVTVHRIEYGPTAGDVKVILSDGKELDAVMSVDPMAVNAGGICAAEIAVRLKAPKEPEEPEMTYTPLNTGVPQKVKGARE